MGAIRYILSFILLVLLQVLIFNNILFYGYLNPYIYVAFILWLPLSTGRGNVLLLAFMLGLCIDLFENSGGVHIAASVLLAYFRRPLLRLTTRKQGADFEDLNINRLQTGNMVVYALVAILLHHYALFLIESYSFRDLGTVLVRTLMSSIFTFIFVLLLQLWRFRRKI